MKMTNKNFRTAILAIVLLGTLSACQKEIEGSALPPYCAPSQLTISTGGSVVVQFTIGYDTVNRRANTIGYTAAGAGSASYTISYSADSIYISNGTVLALDGSGRIRYLREAEGMLTDPGEFFYNYNQAGQMTDRTFDDGINELERNNFSYNQDQLNAYTLDALGVSGLGTGTITYNASPRITDFVVLQNFELLPELFPYAMLGKTGAFTPYPMLNHTLSVNIPGQSPFDLISTYSSYTQNTDGYPTGFQTVLAGGTDTYNFSFEYRCIN